jgi:hypothetical protein
MDTAVVGNSSVKQISSSELLPLDGSNSATVPVGSGTYGDCTLKKFKRFEITVLEKKVPTSDLTAVMNEAQCMNILTHPSIPHLLGVQIDEKPYSLVMQFLGEGMKSVIVHISSCTKTWQNICHYQQTQLNSVISILLTSSQPNSAQPS